MNERSSNQLRRVVVPFLVRACFESYRFQVPCEKSLISTERVGLIFP